MASTRVQASPGPAPLAEVPALASPSQDLSSAGTPLDSRLSCAITIPEEDESNNETGSESLEPITPTDVQFHDSFRHHHVSVDSHSNSATPQPTTVENKAVAMDAATPTNSRPQLSKQTTATSQNGEMSRSGLGARVGSFVRNKLHRAPSNNKASGETPKPTLDTTNVPRASPAPVPASAVMPRRLSSWSMKNSPRSSASNSPPSPSSPSSTVNEDNAGKANSTSQSGHGQSNSLSRLPQPDEKPNRGVTWGAFGTNKEKATSTSRSRPFRRRSASTEIAPRLRTQNSDDPTIGLVDTFSKPALEGAGMKARRLSTSLPDEFNVDYCELDKEFKSTSVVPGKRGRRCGIGATAEVRIMAKKGWGDDLVAVKEYRAREKTENEEEYLKKIKSEFSIANSLHHPNIVSTVRLCTHHGRWNHVMEFCNFGEVYAMVERGLFRSHYKLEDRLCFFKQLLRAVEYLHSHGIAHRDIKLENLLMDKDGHLKLSDFGVSEVFSGAHPGLRESGGQCGKNMGEIRKCAPSICGSLPYIAPEVLDKKDNYDPRCLDVWSCAILFLTMTFGGSPWEAAKVEHQHYAKFKNGWDEWLVNHPDGQIKDEVDGSPKCGPLFRKIEPPALRRLLFKMLHPIPEKRITMREIMQLTFVKNIECCCAESFEDTKCNVNASAKNSGKAATKMVLKKHHHAPPKEISKFRQGLTHRFDMGEGW